MTTQIPFRTTCRVCGSDRLTELFSLGEQCVSDFVIPENVQKGVKCPITLQMCANCTLIQQKFTAPQDFMYSRHYWYKSGVTETMKVALADVVKSACEQVKLEKGDIVLDIGANDGTLLSNYNHDLLVRVGVEPAANLGDECAENCEIFIGDFWSADEYFHHVDHVDSDDTWSNKAKIITAIGMFYDLEDPNRFITDVAKVLHPDGVFIAQLMCAYQTLKQHDVGNLAHEHLEFYTLRSLNVLFNQHGLEIYNIEENAVNGGSYRLFIRHQYSKASGPARVSASTVGFSHTEIGEGVGLPSTWRQWYQNAARDRQKIQDFVRKVFVEQKNVWVYGASTKGNVLLQWWGFDSILINGAADKSPEKWGKLTVGTGIPIMNEEFMRAQNPDYLLVLPYAFINEFVEREAEWLKRGGVFIIPLPVPMLIGTGGALVTKEPL